MDKKAHPTQTRRLTKLAAVLTAAVFQTAFCRALATLSCLQSTERLAALYPASVYVPLCARTASSHCAEGGARLVSTGRGASPLSTHA
ncbi:hypothetical protein TSOC_006343 [Tetrabaena socialis]|uniref:Uncharacterized protein n=1 Tax=Tetrabaena socialis TaxID=47790 RepID=A0A2J8A408_9CHLO|nr:hypothetical protein TSOC_006343 [Tetrabaena socialis]|eukprot:PNH07243.1 hypothetical protein TSOC_006343 [Tetrabaena socialis]